MVHKNEHEKAKERLAKLHEIMTQVEKEHDERQYMARFTSCPGYVVMLSGVVVFFDRVCMRDAV